MAMTKSSSGINVTPLIDILLVLLIVFMVITPMTSRGLEAEIPRPATAPLPAPDTGVVISVAADGSLRINQETVTREQLPSRLKLHRAVFVQGAPDAAYERVVEVIDLARGAGIAQIGLMPR